MGDARSLGSKCPRCGYGTIKVDFLCFPCIRAVEDREDMDQDLIGPRPKPPDGIIIEYGMRNQ